MKYSKKQKKGFDTVKFFRKIKRRISKKLVPMTWEERWAYLDKAPDIFQQAPENQNRN